MDETLGSLVLGMQSLPSITWLPLAILWFGLSEKAIIFVVVMGSVFAIAISARDGVRNIPVLQRRAAQVFGASPLADDPLRHAARHAAVDGAGAEARLVVLLAVADGGRAALRQRRPGAPAAAGPRPEQHGAGASAIMGVIVAVGLAFDRLVFGPLENWVQNRWGLSGR